jgi:hypothetical protein
MANESTFAGDQCNDSGTPVPTKAALTEMAHRLSFLMVVLL